VKDDQRNEWVPRRYIVYTLYAAAAVVAAGRWWYFSATAAADVVYAVITG